MRDGYTVSEGFANFWGGIVTVVALVWFLHRLYVVFIEPQILETSEQAVARRAKKVVSKQVADAEWRAKRKIAVEGPPAHEAKFALIELRIFSDTLRQKGAEHDSLTLSQRQRNGGMEGWRYRYRKGQEKITLFERVVREFEASHGAIDITQEILAQLEHLDGINFYAASRPQADYRERYYGESDVEYEVFRKQLETEHEVFQKRIETERQVEHGVYRKELEKMGRPGVRLRVQRLEHALGSSQFQGSHFHEARRLLDEKQMWESFLGPS